MRQHVEDDLGPGRPGTAAPGCRAWRSCRPSRWCRASGSSAASRAAHLQPDVEALASCRGSAITDLQVLLGDVDRHDVGDLGRRAPAGTGLTSVMTTWRAPTWRATAAAMMPIGPAPVTSTSSPTRSKESAVCTALPSGSRIAPSSSSIVVGQRHGVEGRDLHILGEGAGDVDADAAGLGIEMVAPAPRARGSACR